jgi:hypothetical protein
MAADYYGLDGGGLLRGYKEDESIVEAWSVMVAYIYVGREASGYMTDII